jgi:adenosylcobyric acid synthase
LVASLVMKHRARSVMVLGTASSVGKSIVVTALCRIFTNMGIDVAPFKAQNMSLNSAATPDGFEIGRAQALQAEAARKPATVEMNPVLIKPTSDSHAQVIVNGTIWGEANAWELYRKRPGVLFPEAVAAYERLAERCELIVLEGAGSPAEINLRDGDIVNLRMARAAGAPCILVGDIDRGGVFASLLGTLELLEPEERALIRGFAINKFRGDLALLRPGIDEIERRIGIGCLGVIPWITELGLEEEDSCGAIHSHAPWDLAGEEAIERRLRVAVVELPFVANPTDFDALVAEPEIALRWVRSPAELRGADIVIVPGSKQTLSDLRWLRAHGLEAAIVEHARRRRPVIGLCAGLQMLGMRITDPHRVEGGGEADGLQLLALSTELATHKTTIPVTAMLAVERLFGEPIAPLSFAGYEIHVGVSDARDGARAFARLARANGTIVDDGAVSADGNVVGTYVHGLFDDDAFRHRIIDVLRRACGLAPTRTTAHYSALREARLERLAEHVERALDIERILRLAQLPVPVAR